MSEQRPGQTANQGQQRLASISHHFLSDEPERPGHVEQAGIITVAGRREQPFPTLALAAILVRMGVDCTISEAGRSSIQLRPEADMESPRYRPLRLSIDNDSGGDIDENTDLLLLAVPASEAGLRDGFIRLKQYLCVRPPPRVGLTLLDCKDTDRARLYFGLLRQACRRFLATELCSYGAIAGGHAPGGEHPELTGIARLLTDEIGLAETATPGKTRSGREHHEP